MMWPRQFIRVTLVVICSVALCGCSSSTSGVQDEEKEPHFLVGKSRVNAMDYKGAIESFEKALEVNPHSAPAHFELGCLLTDKEPDPAAAVYHFQQYLKLRPNADNATIINQQIQVLKQDLVKNVLPPSVTPAQQRGFDQLAEENRRLHDEVEKWRAYYASHGGAPLQQSATPAPVPAAVDRATQNPAGAQVTSSSSSPTATMRTHKVQSGETPSSIARKYGVKLEALMAANPGLNPTKMQIGQTLNVPPQ